jgi:hypothetical protein
VDPDLREHGGPELRDIGIADRDRHDTGVDQLEDVFGLEVLIGELDPDRRPAGLLEPRIQRRHALEIAARTAHEHGLPRKVLKRAQRCCARSGHHDLVHSPRIRDEIDLFLTRGGHREARHRDVGVTLRDVGDELVARGRQEQDLGPGSTLGRAVDHLAELSHELVGKAARLEAIVEKEGAVVRHQHAYELARLHPGQIARPGDFARRAARQHGFELGGLRGTLIGRVRQSAGDQQNHDPRRFWRPHGRGPPASLQPIVNRLYHALGTRGRGWRRGAGHTGRPG